MNAHSICLNDLLGIAHVYKVLRCETMFSNVHANTH